MTVTINGTTGYSGPVGTIGDLTTTGNTTLGDASGDTLTLNGNTASIPNGLNFTNGNIGIGATPSAWASGNKAIELTNGSAIANLGNTSQTLLTANTYFNGTNWVYKNTAAATYYHQNSGAHYWFNAGSGTAGASVTFTQAMTLDTNGNLGLGIAPSAWGSSYKALDMSNYTALYGFSGNTSGVVQNAYYNGTNWIYKNTNAASNYVQSGGVHQWQTAGSGTAGTNISFTSGMTLDASGRLGIGETSPTAGLQINRTSGQWITLCDATSVSNGDKTVEFRAAKPGTSYLNLQYVAYQHIFNAGASNSEAARINSSGNLLVGSTSTQGSSVGGQFYDATGYPIYYSTFNAPAASFAGTPVRICARLGETGDPAFGYVLLCKAYQGGATQSFSGFSGCVYRFRGSAGAFYQGAGIQLTVGNAYNSNGYGAVNFGSLPWQIVTCTYSSTVYIAVRCNATYSQGSINIDGVYTNDFTPILVSDGSVSSVTVLATY